jgi:hypothetical protein
VALDRRELLERGGLALAAVAVLGPEALASPEEADAEALAPLPWASVRSQFRLRPDRVHLGAFLLASHPAPVRRAIDRYRRALDADPVGYLDGSSVAREAAVLRAAASYTGARAADIALTDSTTMGLALLYNGLHVRADQELLTSTHDFFVTHDALQLKADRTGATLRKIRLYDDSAAASADAIVQRVVNAVTPRTRVVALTWVHSSTGVKLPIRRIADALALSTGAGAKPTGSSCASTACTASGSRTCVSPRSAATSSPPAATSGSSARAGTASCGAGPTPGSTSRTRSRRSSRPGPRGAR